MAVPAILPLRTDRTRKLHVLLVGSKRSHAACMGPEQRHSGTQRRARDLGHVGRGAQLGCESAQLAQVAQFKPC